MLAIPTKLPVVPKPTLTVDNPIKSLSILATNKVSPSDNVVIPLGYEAPSSKTTIPLPVFGEYVNSSPVFKSCPGI